MNLFEQRWLVLFDNEKVIAVRIHKRLANIPLTKHRIAHDHLALQYKGFEEFKGSLRFVCFRINTRLAQHVAGLMIESGKEMNGSFVPL